MSYFCKFCKSTNLYFYFCWCQSWEIHWAEWRSPPKLTSCSPGWGYSARWVWRWWWLLCWVWASIPRTQRSRYKPKSMSPGSGWSSDTTQSRTGDLLQAAKPTIKQCGCASLVENTGSCPSTSGRNCQKVPVCHSLLSISWKAVLCLKQCCHKLRSSLAPEKLELLVCLYENMRKVKMTYDSELLKAPAKDPAQPEAN